MRLDGRSSGPPPPRFRPILLAPWLVCAAGMGVGAYGDSTGRTVLVGVGIVVFFVGFVVFGAIVVTTLRSPEGRRWARSRPRLPRVGVYAWLVFAVGLVMRLIDKSSPHDTLRTAGTVLSGVGFVAFVATVLWTQFFGRTRSDEQ